MQPMDTPKVRELRGRAEETIDTGMHEPRCANHRGTAIQGGRRDHR